ncbi:MAG: NUDIX domain-containing protein [Acidimicrobiia bacterium]
MAKAADLQRWAAGLAEVAGAGLRMTASLYERERFEEVARIAADIRVAAASLPETAGGEVAVPVPHGIAGFPPGGGPKAAVGALVGNDEGEILLVQRSDSGAWLFPAGLADIGYSPAEVAVKETAEETGMAVEPVSLAAVFDATRFGVPLPLYLLVFACRLVGGRLRPHPLETTAAGFFPRERLPGPLVGGDRWVDLAFAALSGPPRPCAFD